jgi:hypothetical protein
MRLKALFACLLLILASAFLSAEENAFSPPKNVLILAAGEVHQGDYFAMGTSVEISGTVNGDVYVLAEQVVIDGVVHGDVLGCVGSIDISGTVSGNCRLVAGQVLISGAIGNNVTALAANFQVLSSAAVGGSLVTAAGNVDLAAGIGTDAVIAASNLRLSSHIRNDLQAYVGHMRITSKGSVGGNVDYKSSSEAWIEKGAIIHGTITHHPSFVHGLVKGTWIQGLLVGSKVLALLMNFIYTFVVGILLIKVFPKNLKAALSALTETPVKSFSCGAMLLVLLPLVSLLLLMTILGVPFALTLIALNIIGFYTAKVYPILWVSQWLFGKIGFTPGRLPGLFCGLILYFAVTWIPIFGTLVAIVAMLFGVGCAALAQTRRGIFTGS